MQPGTIILLNGASSSGKTSILSALQDLLPEPFLNAGIDKFIWMLPERYLERPLWDDVLGLATEAGQMGHRLFSAMHQAVALLSRAGMNVVADHVLVEPAWVAQCAALLADLPAYLVGVRCPLDVLVEREKSRKTAPWDRQRRNSRWCTPTASMTWRWIPRSSPRINALTRSNHASRMAVVHRP